MPAFAGTTDLHFDGSQGVATIPERDVKLNYRVTAPSDADDTSLAYFAITPVL